MNRNGLPWIHGVQLDACGFISSGWFCNEIKSVDLKVMAEACW